MKIKIPPKKQRPSVVSIWSGTHTEFVKIPIIERGETDQQMLVWNLLEGSSFNFVENSDEEFILFMVPIGTLSSLIPSKSGKISVYSLMLDSYHSVEITNLSF